MPSTAPLIAQLIRLDKPVGIALLLLPCWWGVLSEAQQLGASQPLSVYGWFALGAFAMRSAGCIVNDMADRKIDRRVRRTASRPLASGALSMRHAVTTLIALLLLALLSALMLGDHIVLMGLCWLPLVVAYPFMKRITFWPQAFLGITFGSGPLFGAMAVSASLPLHVWVLYGASICWTIAYDTIYACQDIEDDRAVGVKSTARLFGEHINYWITGFYVATLVLLWLSRALTASFTPASIILLIIVSALFIWQARRFTPSDTMRCAHLFKESAWIGTLICFVWLL